jgi:hypothetical protein
MRKIKTACLGLLLFSAAHGQVDAITGNLTTGPTFSVHGKLSTGFLESFKSGSPLFTDEWKPAVLLLEDSTTVPNIPVRLNLVTQEVYYQANGQQYVASSPINEIRMQDAAKELVFVNGSRLQGEPGVWYLQVLPGTASLYKRIVKVIEESRQYSSATVDRSIVSKEQFFIHYRFSLQEVTRLRDLPEIFFEKRAEISAFLEQKKYRKLSEAALLDVVTYFNGLER